jgi:uncharacterized membrane protein
VTDVSGPVNEDKAGPIDDDSLAGAVVDRNVRSAYVGASEHGHRDSEDGSSGAADTVARRLLVGYSEALDSVAAKSSIFLRHGPAPQRSARPYLILPGANRMAAILAEAHVAARVDALIRRGHRFRAIGLGDSCPFDPECLQEFRDSLSPVKWKTLALWVTLLALAVSFPVAWVTDYVRTLVPKAIVCSSKFSFSSFFESPNYKPHYATLGCSVHHVGASLVNTFLQVAHLNLSPGSVIDTVLSVRARGFAILLLLTVVMILSLCVVLLVFRAGFQLKRLAFSFPREESVDHESLFTSGIGASGLYALEDQLFNAVGLRCPREFPLDLIVGAGLLMLPLTITVDLFITATIPQLGMRTRTELAVVATGLLLVLLLRLAWLVRVWRCRNGLKVIEPQRRWLPDGTSVLVRSGVYGAVLLSAACVFWDLIFAEFPDEPVSVALVIVLLVGPAFAWPLSMFWWYRMHRELAAYGRLHGSRIFRAPLLSVIPSVALAAVVILTIVQHYSNNRLVQSDNTYGIEATLVLIAVLCVLISIYRMAWKLGRLRYQVTRRVAWRAFATGAVFTVMFFLPAAVIVYFQRSLNRIWQEIASTDPGQLKGAKSGPAD